MDRTKKKIGVKILLILIVCGQLLYSSYLFTNKKESHHSDETWSYGYSNAYYYGQLYVDGEGYLRNIDHWIDGKVFKDYLQVNAGERFNYGSVAYNLEVDKTTSPLFYMLLHTICSIFPNTFSWWYGFSINLAAFAVTLLFFYLTATKMLKSEGKALLALLFVGFTTGMLSCTLFIRAYALLTMWTMLQIYLHALLFEKHFEKCGKLYITIGIVTLLGGLTQYYFFVISFFIAAAVDIYLLVSHKLKDLLAYSAALILGVLMGLILWPKAIVDAGNSNNLYGQQPGFFEKFKMGFNYFVGESTGLNLFISQKTFISMLIPIIALLVFICAIGFVLRNENWAQNLCKRLKKSLIGLAPGIRRDVKESNIYQWILLVAALCTALVVTKISSIIDMAQYSDRYYFFLFPINSLLIVIFVDYLVSKIVKKKQVQIIIMSVSVFLLLISNHVNYPINYFFDWFGGERLENLVPEQSDLIMIMDESWKMIYYADFLQDKNDILIINDTDLMEYEYSDEMKSYSGDDLYLVLTVTYLPYYDKEGNVKYYVSNDVISTKGRDFTEINMAEKIVQLPYVADLEHIGYARNFGGLVSVYKVILN